VLGAKYLMLLAVLTLQQARVLSGSLGHYSLSTSIELVC
jgi:hypothetical protein